MLEEIDKSIVGKTYGRLTVLDLEKRNKKIYCKCICKCGNICNVEKYNLITLHSSSCGCLVKNKAYSEMIGKRFGKLIVLEELLVKDSNGHRHFLCQCDCGNKVDVLGVNLLYKQTESCGCLRRVGLYNAKLRKNNTSGIKGVCFDKKTNKYIAYVSVKGKKIRRYCSSIDEADRKRKELEKLYYEPVIENLNNKSKIEESEK